LTIPMFGSSQRRSWPVISRGACSRRRLRFVGTGFLVSIDDQLVLDYVRQHYRLTTTTLLLADPCLR
jgi:hypothetical protein